MKFKINHRVVTNLDGQIIYKDRGEKDLYHLELWVEGSSVELDEVSKVEYLLHPTFKKRRRFSANRDKNFQIGFWTWGTFLIQIRIFSASGEIIEQDYQLKYSLPADDGSNYLEV